MVIAINNGNKYTTLGITQGLENLIIESREDSSIAASLGVPSIRKK